jgi:23S rRNA A2030 N6-methylase RlmJ
VELNFDPGAVAERRRCAELNVDPTRKKGMYGCGLVLFNPPWTLKPALEEALPVLASTLGGGKGTWELQWEEPNI